MGQSPASPAMLLPRAPITDATLYHSPMPEAASESMHLPIQMGQNILELEPQQHWMMHQQTNPNPYQQTGNSNHYPSTISAGVFPQDVPMATAYAHLALHLQAQGDRRIHARGVAEKTTGHMH
jgi:hypothetical protein